MKRREFVTASTLGGLGLGASAAIGGEGEKPGKELIELRIYHFASPAKMAAFDEFLAKAAVPAINRAGVAPVGVFKLLKEDNPSLKLEADGLDLYVLRPYKSAEQFVSVPARLGADKEFQEAGKDVLEAPKPDPAFTRYESSLMLAFDGFPKVEAAAKGAARLFQLRIYESHNEERARKKIAMFNEGGEINIFHRCGMTAVFFGQTLIGPKLPCLTYMLGFDDKAAMDKGWGAFRNDPDWKKLSADTAYKDTVSTITNLILRPASSSQI